MVICGGSGVRLKEVWVGDRLAWSGDIGTDTSINIDVTFTEEGREEYPQGIRGTIDFHSGSYSRNSYILSHQGGAGTPTWPHLTYAVLRGTGGGGAYIGTSKKVEHIKFVVERRPSHTSEHLADVFTQPAALAVLDPLEYDVSNINGDANPAFAIAELLVEDSFCAGLPTEMLDGKSFAEAAITLYNEGHGVMHLWGSQRTTGEVIIDICKQIGGIVQPDPLTGKQKLRLLRETDVPLLTLDDSNILRLDEFSRTSVDETTNTLSATYTSKSARWVQQTVEVQDIAAIEIANQVISGTTNYAGVSTAALASRLAMRDLRALSSPLASARLTAIVPQRQRFMPGDVVVLSSAAHGVLSLRMRVTSARYATPGAAQCELDLVEDVFTSGTAVYNPPEAVPSASTYAVPAVVNASDLTVIQAPYALTGDDADHGMCIAFSPSASTTRFDLGWYDGTPALVPLEVQYTERSSYNFSAKGTLAAALADVTAPSSLVVNIDALSADALRKLGTKSAYVFIESVANKEILQATSVTVAGDGLSATLSGITRGVFDTVPYAQGAGASVTVVCDYAIDPARMDTDYYSAPGVLALSLDGRADLSATATGKSLDGLAVRGTSKALSIGDGWGSTDAAKGLVRAALPYPVASLKLAGAYGSSTSASATAIAGLGTTMTVSFKQRDRTLKALSGWANGDVQGEAAVHTSITVEHFNGSAWETISSQVLGAGVLSADFTAPDAGAAPALIRVTATAFRDASGVLPGIQSKPQTWYFRLTS